MYYLYILKCADATLYTGITTDTTRRVSEHNGKGKLGAKYTAARRPVRLVYSKKFKNRANAACEEARVKKMKRTEKINLIREFSFAKKLFLG